MTLIRGKWAAISPHAYDGMDAERPPVDVNDVCEVLETPDHDDGRQAIKWIGRRTIIVYYEEEASEIRIRGVSATRRRLPT